MSTITDDIVIERFIYLCPSCNYHVHKDINDKVDTTKTCPNCNTEMIKSKLDCKAGSLKSKLEISE